MIVIVPTDWTSIMTAIGTVAMAVVAVALFVEWRAGIGVKDEREHAARVLADQQELHDTGFFDHDTKDPELAAQAS